MSRHRLPRRLVKAFDRYTIKTGSAGFALIYKNDKRITPKNAVIKFSVRRSR